MPADHTLVDVMSTIDPGKKMMTIARTLESSPILGLFQTEANPTGSNTFFIENNLPNPDYKEFNVDPDDQDGLPDDPITTHNKRMRVRIKIDQDLAERNTRNGVPYKVKEVRRNIRAMSLNWKKFLIGRTEDSARPRGLYGWVKFWEKNGIFKGQRINFATNGTTVATAGSATLMNKMSQLIDAVYEPDFFITSRNIMNQIKNFFETGAATEKFAEKVKFEHVEIMPGVRPRVITFEGIPMFAADRDSQEAEIFLFDETVGTSNITSSILAVRTGEELVTLLQEHADGPKIRETDDGLGNDITVISWLNSVEARHERSIAQLEGFLTA